MIKIPLGLVLLAAFLTAGCVENTQPAIAPAPTPAASPYAGEDARPVKALSEDDVKALLAGDGHGYAKAAELNHYPGPSHALAMADALELNREQREVVEQARAAMKAEAIRLGRMLVDAEADLDALFASGEADAERVGALVREIGRIESDLRTAHLVAHLTTRDTLTAHQVNKYDEIRGYGKDTQGSAPHGH